MYLKIVKFRCYDRYIIDIPDNQSILLSGPTGAGKSSIMYAIKWALYGNIKHIDPHSSERSKTKIKLRMRKNNKTDDQITIVRRRNPGHLKVIDNDMTFIMKEAQNHIDSIFGTEKLWSSINFIEQGMRCGFLSLSQSDRLAILSNIIFGDSDPNEVVEKIRNHSSKNRDHYLKAIGKYDNIYDRCKHLISEFRRYFKTNIYNADDINNSTTISSAEIYDNIKKYETIIANVTDNKMQITILKSNMESKLKYINTMRRQTETLIKKWNNNMESCPENIDHNLKYFIASTSEQLYIDIEKLKKCVDYINEISEKNRDEISNLKVQSNKVNDNIKHKSRLTHINNELGCLCKWPYEIQPTEADAIDAAKYERQTNDDISILINHNIIKSGNEYIERNMSNIKANVDIILNECYNIQKFQDKKAIYDKIIEISEKLSKFCNIIALDELENRKNELLDLLKRKEDEMVIYDCPQCNTKLSLKNGQLIINNKQQCHHSISEIKRNLNTINADITNANSHAKFFEQLSQMKILIGDDDAFNQCAQIFKRKIDFRSNQRKINDLEKIGYEPYPIPSSKQINDALKAINLQSQISYISSIIDNTMPDQQVIKTKINDLTKIINLSATLNDISIELISRYNEYINVDDEYQKLKDALNIKMNNEHIDTVINNFDCEIKSYRDKIIEQKLKIDELKLLHQISNEYNELSNAKFDVDEKMEYFVGCEKLIALALRVWYVKIESTLGTINNDIEQIISMIFDEPIEVVLESLRTGKEVTGRKRITDKTAQKIGLRVSYHGRVCDALNYFSGGEGDRISIALNLALNKCVNSPLLMLDESLASLDSDNKIAAINVITQFAHTNKCTVIVVQHEGSLSAYDKTFIIGQ